MDGRRNPRTRRRMVEDGEEEEESSPWWIYLQKNRYEPWNQPRYWKSNNECLVCGCSRHAEYCLCGLCCRRGGCIYENRYEPWNQSRYWKSYDECSVCGCSRRAENCLCNPCRRGGCIYKSSAFHQLGNRYEPWNQRRYWKSNDECSICGCSRQAENCLCNPYRFGGCIHDGSLHRSQFVNL